MSSKVTKAPSTPPPSPSTKPPSSKPDAAPPSGSPSSSGGSGSSTKTDTGSKGGSEATDQAGKGARSVASSGSGSGSTKPNTAGSGEGGAQAREGAKQPKPPKVPKEFRGATPSDPIPDGAVEAALARQGIDVDAKDLARLKGAAAGAAPAGTKPEQKSSEDKAAEEAAQLKAKYLEGDTGNGLNPDLEYRLALIGKDLDEKVTIESGNRTYEEQEKLYAAYQAGTGNLAAPPGSSNHEGGNAADVYIGGTALRDHAEGAALAEKYGLGFPVSSESWHTEIVGDGPSDPSSGSKGEETGPPAFMVPDEGQTDEDTVRKFVEQSAEAYGVNPKVMTGIAERESGWDVGAKNDWDINAQNGTPSEGLMQFIPDTFDRIASEARQAKPELWKGLGEPDFHDWRQQALAAAYGVKNGNGPEWATFDDAVADAGGTVEIDEKRFKGVEKGTPTGASDDASTSGGGSTTSTTGTAPVSTSSSGSTTASSSSSGGSTSGGSASAPAASDGSSGGSSSGGGGGGGGRKRGSAAPQVAGAAAAPSADAAPADWQQTAGAYQNSAMPLPSTNIMTPTTAPTAAPAVPAAPAAPAASVAPVAPVAPTYAPVIGGGMLPATNAYTAWTMPVTTDAAAWNAYLLQQQQVLGMGMVAPTAAQPTLVDPTACAVAPAPLDSSTQVAVAAPVAAPTPAPTPTPTPVATSPIGAVETVPAAPAAVPVA